MSGFKDYKAKKSVRITGSTTINHSIRVKGQLSCMEYVMLVYLDNREKRKEHKDNSHCTAFTGYSTEEQNMLIKLLTERGFLLPFSLNIPYHVTSQKWRDLFLGIEMEFEQFWHIEHENEDGKKIKKAAWTDTKKTAFRVFSTVRKSHDFDYLLKQRNIYFDFLNYTNLNGFDRRKMGCAVWLNPLNEKFNANWKIQLEEERKKYEETFGKEIKESKQPLSEEDLNSNYAE